MSQIVILCAVACGLVGTSIHGPTPRVDIAQLPHSISLADAASMGQPDARIVIIEYSDFHCPFCRKHAADVMPQIIKTYIDPGQVLYVFRHFPLDSRPRATDAAVAAVCAERQGKFWALHNRLFSAPRPVQPDDLEGHAKRVGVDLAKFRLCTKGIAREDVRTDVTEARRFGLAGTPGFVLGLNDGDRRMRPSKRLGGAQPFAIFKAAIDALLLEK